MAAAGRFAMAGKVPLAPVAWRRPIERDPRTTGEAWQLGGVRGSILPPAGTG